MPAADEPPAPRPEAQNQFRIMISTDNHLGHLERDVVRGDDSFVAFEEVLSVSATHGPDILLLGGDLFHDNKPSRECLVKSMNLFRKYCCGSRECMVEPLDVTSMGNPEDEEEQVVNYQDPNINISMPVFIIHGNHDDPCGPGQHSALDVLSTARLLNYFGKQANVADIVIRPLLLRKGDIKVALYGLGNIRDERLAQAFQDQKVKWEIPDDHKDYFNILVIHQNRPDRGSKHAFPIDSIPHIIQFVVWGHEHECMTELAKEGEKSLKILQPGSTTVTSLVASESKIKHCFCLDIRYDAKSDGHKFRCRAIKLNNIRPFVYAQENLEGNCGVAEQDVKDYLEQKIRNMIEDAKNEYPDAPEALKKPLVCLKVEHSGFNMPGNMRFGELFGAGQKVADWEVANPTSILNPWKKQKARQQASKANPGDKEEEEEEEILEAPEIEKLVIEELSSDKAKGQKLEILAQSEVCDAVNEFVNKDQPKAIKEMLEKTLSEVEAVFRQGLDEGGLLGKQLDKPEDFNKVVLEKMSERQKEKDKLAAQQQKADGGAGGSKVLSRGEKALAQLQGRAQPRKKHQDDSSDDDDGGGGAPPPKSKPAAKKPAAKAAGAAKGRAAAKAAPKKAPAASKRKRKDSDDDDDDEEVMVADSPPKKAAGGSSQRASGRRKAPVSYQDKGEDDDEGGGGGDDDEDDEEELKRKRAKRRRGDDDD